VGQLITKSLNVLVMYSPTVRYSPNLYDNGSLLLNQN